jgi:hypothetical protein
MPNHAEAMRMLAENYLRMARISNDPYERRKFLEYASLYAELTDKSVRQENLTRWTVFTETSSGRLKRSA